MRVCTPTQHPGSPARRDRRGLEGGWRARERDQDERVQSAQSPSRSFERYSSFKSNPTCKKQTCGGLPCRREERGERGRGTGEERSWRLILYAQDFGKAESNPGVIRRWPPRESCCRGRELVRGAGKWKRSACVTFQALGSAFRAARLTDASRELELEQNKKQSTEGAGRGRRRTVVARASLSLLQTLPYPAVLGQWLGMSSRAFLRTATGGTTVFPRYQHRAVRQLTSLASRVFLCLLILLVLAAVLAALYDVSQQLINSNRSSKIADVAVTFGTYFVIVRSSSSVEEEGADGRGCRR